MKDYSPGGLISTLVLSNCAQSDQNSKDFSWYLDFTEGIARIVPGAEIVSNVYEGKDKVMKRKVAEPLIGCNEDHVTMDPAKSVG